VEWSGLPPLANEFYPSRVSWVGTIKRVLLREGDYGRKRWFDWMNTNANNRGITSVLSRSRVRHLIAAPLRHLFFFTLRNGLNSFLLSLELRWCQSKWPLFFFFFRKINASLPTSPPLKHPGVLPVVAEQNSTVCGRGGIDNLPRTIVYVLYTAQRFFIDLLILLLVGGLFKSCI
jgi:hypothetical protein